MSNTKSTFDNIGVVNNAKRFEQSQDKELNHLDVPDIYQEFEEIEHEIERSTHSVNEVTMFADKLSDARVVRREDVLALESIVGELESLPHINSYTMDYSLVNYQITQENVLVTVTKFLGGLLKKIAEYIAKAFSFIKKHVTNVLYRNAYTDSTSKQEDVKDNLDEANAKAAEAAERAAAGNAGATSVVTGTSPVDVDGNPVDTVDYAARTVAKNKQLRKLLYPKFKELQVISAGGQINPMLLFDEVCAQRMSPFYTTFFKSLYEKDEVLKTTVDFLARRIRSDFIVLVDRTEKFYSQDISAPIASPYQTMYDTVPEQIIDFMNHYSPSKLKTGANAKDYKDVMTDMKDLTKSICSLATIHPLPEPRTILKFDLNWLGELFDDNVTNIGRDIELQFKDIAKAQKVILRNSDNINSDAQRDMMLLYSDWMVLNRMTGVIALMRRRANAMYENINNISTLIIEATDILNY